jgi:hypothetical protein
MESQNDRRPFEEAPPAVPPPKKRFHIEKLEERIAPAAHYNPHSKWVGNGGGGDSSASGSLVSGSIY